MGILLNPGSTLFQKSIRSEIYVDKSELIKITNRVINTEQQFLCVSRPRRFGKSMAANMLSAYYSREGDSLELFEKLKISGADSFKEHLNRYNVIHINMIEFLSESNSINEMLDLLRKSVLFEIIDEFPDVNYFDKTKLTRSLKDIFAATEIPFVFIIDEWDCVFREHKNDTQSQTVYLDFLRSLLKDQSYVALAYMTGILPIKKYGKHSALNMFTEVSITNPREYSEFTGFTEAEAEELCKRYDMDFDEVRRWYDGYNLKGISVYNPRSVVMSMTGHDYDNYWTSTETYEALKVYIEMNFDGLREKISAMIAGESVTVNTGKFQNDMTTLRSADDVLTLLIHLGYLTFKSTGNVGIGKAWIPNSEVQQEFINSIEDGGWDELMKSIRSSDELVQATIDCDEEKVAEMIEQSHQDNTSILKYNDENALACVISLAYYSAREKYIMHRELPTGKGFADIVFIPRKNIKSPAMLIELKYNKSAESAVEQIKNKKYTDKLSEYSGEILLVGISYDDNKGHSCKIEKFVLP